MNIDTRDPLIILVGLILGFALFGVGLVLMQSVLMTYVTTLIRFDSAWSLGLAFLVMGIFALTLGFYGLVDLSIGRVSSKSRK